jgi:hypothetical protein
MFRKFILIFSALCYAAFSHGQVTLDYFLPKGTTYDPSIPTPVSVVGHEMATWHLTHDKMVQYMQALAAASPRVSIDIYGKSYEDRPLVSLAITSPENQQKLEDIRLEHAKLSDPRTSGNLNLDQMPAVVFMGYNIHGNEPSGGNAAVIVAYHLAAAQGEAIENLLKNTVILLDPCFNPDGFHKFSTWVNAHKSIGARVTDPNSREFSEVWPGSRYNHYWFDLNRDWLPVQHPESYYRIAKYQQWRPNILTDHHEMGTNATFFFQPGVPARVNPLTPPINQQLTARIGKYHAKTLDQAGSLYYTQEGFDDFYIGKGSTYPDVQGCVGILFEQASSRGHAQENQYGVLTFEATIKNQVLTSFSTLEAARDMRKDLLEYQRSFYREAAQKAQRDPVKAYVFGAQYDEARNQHLADILHKHGIQTFQLKKDLSADGQNFKAGKAWVVPLEQAQYTLVKGIFMTQTQFADSLFYDISTWTMPYAFGLPHAALSARNYAPELLGTPYAQYSPAKAEVVGGQSEVGYIMEWDSYYAPKALYQMLNRNMLVKVATKPSTFNVNGQPMAFTYGSLLIPVAIQPGNSEQLYKALQDIAAASGISIYALGTGQAESGIDMGSSSFELVKKPRVLIVGGRGSSNTEIGEIWHLFDQRYQIPVTIAEMEFVGGMNLGKYTTVVMVSGTYNNLGTVGRQKIKDWVQQGGTLIAIKGGANWAKNNELSKVEFKTQEPATRPYANYADYSNITGARLTAGAIFEVELDITHPIGYGFRESTLAIFRDSNTAALKHKNPFATPLRYTDKSQISGYVTKENLEQFKGSASILVDRAGAGRVISMIDNPNFRAFWFGTNKLFTNAVFFGNLISSGTAQ